MVSWPDMVSCGDKTTLDKFCRLMSSLEFFWGKATTGLSHTVMAKIRINVRVGGKVD